MTQVVQVNGDYKIKTPLNKSVTLDTGDVFVTGNLTVQGNSTVMEVANLQIEDRIITVNKGEQGAGVTGIYAGIDVDRGSANNVAILYNETDDTWEFVEETLTGYSVATSKLKVNQIVTDVTVNNGNLQLIGNHIGVLTVPNLPFPDSYTDQILNRANENDIPNKGYVDFAVSNAPPPSDVGSGDTRILARDKDVFNDGVSVSSITVSVDNFTNIRFFSDRTDIHNFKITENIFENTVSGQNLILATTDTGKVEIYFGLQIDNLPEAISDPLPVEKSSIIFTKPPGVADSGVYFVNSAKPLGDELISKNKALVFSMLF